MRITDVKAEYTKVAAPRRLEQIDMLPWHLFPYLLVVLLLFTLVSLFHVWSRVTVIDLNLQIQEANRVMKEERQESNRLHLEVASLKAPARIEALAKGELGMVLPSDQQVIVVK